MAKMPQDCMDLINNAYAVAVSTCDESGTPNGVCWLHVEEVYSVTPGSEAGERIA